MKNIPYATQWIDKNDIREVVKALSSDYLTQGPGVEEFEGRVADYCGVRFAVAVNSGTSALHIACLASGLKKGDEGITSPVTFVASSNCMLYCGATPVFADVDPADICIDPEQIEKNMNKRTKIIIPVHFAGNPCDMKKISVVAKKHGLTVIEDACHALGAEYAGDKIGSCRFSDMTVLSFHAVKHITTGEGGMVLTNDKALFEKLKSLRTHGITRDKKVMKGKEGGWYYEMQSLGFNYRITDFQCALGSSQMKKLDSFVKRRTEIAEQYDKAFSLIDEVRTLGNSDRAKSSHHLYVLMFRMERFKCSRKQLFDAYRNKGIMVNVHYIPVYQHPYYRQLKRNRPDCPNAEAYYRSCVTLPLFPKMTGSDVRRVIDITKSIIREYRNK